MLLSLNTRAEFVQVTMFEEIIKDMYSMLFLLAVLLLGFALSFWVELDYFHDPTSSFSTYGAAVFSTFQMSLGEQDVSGGLRVGAA